MTKKRTIPEYVSPYPQAFNIGRPEALKTELVTRNQIRKDEGTLIWGTDDALPVRILDAIAKSPTTTACIGKVEMYTRGAGFEDEELMNLVINKDGDTLWDLHCELVSNYCSLDGFSTNFKFDSGGKIINTYSMDVQAIRYAAEAETETITGIKYNPYFGTTEYRKAFTKEYSIFDTETVSDEIKKKGTKFNGQVFFHAEKRSLFKHYPVPKFWAGEKWIYSDAKMSTYIDKILDNGFFESVLMNVIGDPNKPSKRPEDQREETGNDGVKRPKSTKTEGQVFGEMMAQNFSGVEKAAKAMVMWSLSHDTATKIQAFPTNVDFDFVSGTMSEIIRMISLSTETPAILANLPDTTSPLSGQDALPKAIEFMQSNTAAKRSKLENFYNNIMLPNLAKAPKKANVKIKQYYPTKVQVTVDDKFWDFMNEAEKIAFIETNEPSIKIIRPPEADLNTASPTIGEDGKVIPAPTAPAIDETLKGLKVAEINRLLSIIKKVAAGTLTADQAKLLLAGYGLNEQQIDAFLNPTLE